MAHEPKKRMARSRKNVRRGAKQLSAIKLTVCANCNATTLAHMACKSCGFYAGKSVKAAKTSVNVTRA